MANTLSITIGRDISGVHPSGSKLILGSRNWLEFKLAIHAVIDRYEEYSQNTPINRSTFQDKNTWKDEHEDSYHISVVFDNSINIHDREMIKGAISSLKKAYHQESISIQFGETELI